MTIAAVSSGILAGGIFTYFSLGMSLDVYLRATMDVLVLRDPDNIQLELFLLKIDPSAILGG